MRAGAVGRCAATYAATRVSPTRGDCWIGSEERMTKSRMYDDVVVWNPQAGCLFDCRYCVPTFKAQAKRQRQNCERCYKYEPHEHPERLATMPKGGKGKTLFVCSSGDLAFATMEFTNRIIQAVREYDGDVLLQSKRPDIFLMYARFLPPNVILGTTLETNRDEGYKLVSKARPPTERWRQFCDLRWPRKCVTVEPIMDFDLDNFSDMLTCVHGEPHAARSRTVHPAHVWFGYNSKPKQVELPEPSPEKVVALMERLVGAGIDVRGKDLRGLEVPEWQPGKNTQIIMAEQNRAKGW